MSETALRRALADVPSSVLHLKGFVALDDGRVAQVQSAGGPGRIEGYLPGSADATRLVAIGLREAWDRERLDALFPA